MTKQLSALVIGAGNRGNVWIEHGKKSEAGIVPVAVADPDKEKRDVYVKKYNIPAEGVFETGEEALEKGTFDSIIIASPDKTHHKLAIQALEKGNHVLLEKPMATTEQDCRDIIQAQKEAGTVLSVGHVLRYSDFFSKVRDIVASKELGDVTEIELEEHIGYWHMPHSYVRGNWAVEAKSSPIILAKSCHDLDLMSWFANSTAKFVSSDGGESHFRLENAPEGSLERCTDGCKVDCLYNAEKFYNQNVPVDKDGIVSTWPYGIISPSADPKERRKALEEGPYGRCVYRCDNDVLGYQNVSVIFENGVKGQFRLREKGEDMTRFLRMTFSHGELEGNNRGNINTILYTGVRKQGIRNTYIMKDLGGHGGGDPKLIKDFADKVRSPDSTQNRTSAELSLQSHLIAFAAERSRKLDSQRVTL